MAIKSGPLRDALVLVVVFAVLLGGLYLYTQTWPPAVIVESSSMMHVQDPATGLGTIDPGDLVLVKHISTPMDVVTLVEGGATHYGKPGDVLIYFPDDRHDETPIIHRAVGFVDVRTDASGATTYYLRWPAGTPCEGGATLTPDTQADVDAKLNGAGGAWCVYGSDGVYVPSVPIARLGSTASSPEPYKPEHTGFLTKGDNPRTNTNIDQVSGLSHTVEVSWVEGKGRGELPWLGLIKLSLAGHANERNPPPEWPRIGSAYAPEGLWWCLGGALFVLVGLPLLYDGYKAVQARRGKSTSAPEAPRDVEADAGPSSVTVRWAPVPGAASYRVYRGPTVVGTTSETRYTENGLDAALSYVYAVAAVDANGVEGAKSRTTSAMPDSTSGAPGAGAS